MRSSRPRRDPFAALSPVGQSHSSIVETAHDVDMLRCPALDKDWELISQLAYKVIDKICLRVREVPDILTYKRIEHNSYLLIG